MPQIASHQSGSTMIRIVSRSPRQGSIKPVCCRCIAGIVFALSLLPSQVFALLPFTQTGNLYVSMWTADEIAVFSPAGEPLLRFGAEGLDGPRGLAFDPVNGEIWVAAELSNALFVFNREHELLRRIDHPDFDEPVGITFSPTANSPDQAPLVYISNSNGNEVMVLDLEGNLLRRFTDASLADPNCAAFMMDGSLMLSNRLGSTLGGTGAVAKFAEDESFQFDFTSSGISSLMAVARDANNTDAGSDDTVWVTSGGGDNGIYEFDQSGNLLTTLLPADIDDARAVVPQGIAFDANGDFYVVSYLNEVIKFDGDGNFLLRFPTGAGTSRSTAFSGPIDSQAPVTDPEIISPVTPESEITPATNQGGGGSAGMYLSGFLLLVSLVRTRRYLSRRC